MEAHKDGVEVTVSVKWSEGVQPQKCKFELQKVFQTWANNYARETGKPQECTVVQVLEDGRAVLRIEPAPAKKRLQEMIGQTLPRKDGKTVTITSISPTSSELETSNPKEASEELPPSSALEPQNLEEQLGEQSSDMSTSTSNIPLHHYWYVTQAYKEEIEHIEKESGVKIIPEVKLTFEVDQSDGNQKYAFSEFTNLVQKCAAESRGFTVPLKKVNPEALKDTLKIIQRPENKLLLTLSSEEINIFGPRQNQDAIKKSLNATQKTLTNTATSAGESAQISQDPPLNISKSIKDPHVHTGLTMGERNSKVMKTSSFEPEAKINQRPEEATRDNPPSSALEPQNSAQPLTSREQGTQTSTSKDQGTQTSASNDQGAQDKDEVEVTVLFKWLEGVQGVPPQKNITDLQKIIHSWSNKNAEETKQERDYKVVKVLEDGRAVLKIKPAPAVRELHELIGQTLKAKDGKPKVQITSLSLKPLELETPKLDEASREGRPLSNTESQNNSQDEQESKFNKRPEEASRGPSPSSGQKPQDVQMSPVEESYFSSSAAVSSAGEETCSCPLPVNHFWCMNHIYANEIKQIERKNRVTIDAEVIVTFKANQKNGDQRQAFSEFIDLAQKCLGESDGSVFPLKYVEPQEFKDTLRIIQRPENKLLPTLSSEKMIVFGPRQNQDAISKSFNEMQRTVTSTITSTKKSSQGSQGPLMDISKHLGAMETRGLPKKVSSVHLFKGGSKKHVLNRQSGYSMRNTEATTGEGATSGDNKDELCPVCIDTFTKKTTLKCKHAFCEECLEQAKEILGPICPVCREVFGPLEGNQPDGNMSWSSSYASLPGYTNCGTIMIHYDIPSGMQTKRHPNPGQHYSGIQRIAYLPDNKEGQEVLKLLKKAFDRKLIFTVGTSRTTGMDNQVTWNDIQHKTSTSGGPQCFGYPDPNYLSRVKDELKAKGIK